MQDISNLSNNYQLFKQLTKGTFTQVSLVKCKTDNQMYIFKRIKLLTMTKKDKQSLIDQIKLICSLDQKYLVQIKQYYYDYNINYLSIFMEYINKDDVSTIINDHLKKKIKVPQSLIWQVISDTLSSLHYIHHHKILHKNLKPSNIFLSNQGKYKLSDIKIITRQLADSQRLTSFCVSPQIWQDLPYNQKSDVWSLGCIIYEMAALCPPFKSNDIYGLYQKIKSGKYKPIPCCYSHDLALFVKLMLAVPLRTRASTQYLLKHPILKKRQRNQGIERWMKRCENFEELLVGNKKLNEERRGIDMRKNRSNSHRRQRVVTVDIKNRQPSNSSHKNRPLSIGQMRVPRIRILNPQHVQVQKPPFIKQRNPNYLQLPVIHSYQMIKINVQPKTNKKRCERSQDKYRGNYSPIGRQRCQTQSA